MSRRARVWLVIVALMGMYSGWPLGAVEAQVYTWASLRDADFPAFVQAIVFASGIELKSGSSVRWGQWAMWFGDKRPVAKRHGLVSEGGVGYRDFESILRKPGPWWDAVHYVPCSLVSGQHIFLQGMVGERG